MCFGILATFLSKTNPENTYVIDNKYAVDKTFPDFWSYLSQSGIGLAAPPDLSQMYNTARIPSCNSRKSFILVGQRGAAKTTLGRQLAKKLDYAAVDLDELVTE